jgi:pimeloyl-ACP methyl ester carboxylesterase
MLKALLYRSARHQSVRRFFIFLFQCTCVVTLFSTVCYIVDLRSRYHPLWKDYSALAQYSELLWNASSLPPPVAPTSRQQWPIVHTRDEPLLRHLNASLSRAGATTLAALDGYGVERTECLWSMVFDPAAATTTSVTPTGSIPPIHLHLFFLHGNAGSHRQGEYWSCAVQHASNLLGVTVSTYSFRWAEQANVHRGRLLQLQANYVTDVVEAVVRAATSPNRSRVPHRVWLVAHSMGGVVARLAAQLLDSSVDFGGILTFNSPHRFPPLLLDAPMASVYRALTVAEQAAPRIDRHKDTPTADELHVGLSSAVFTQVCGSSTEAACLRHRRRQSRLPHLISITSGEMDLQIEPATVHPSPWPNLRYAMTFVNTLDHTICTRSSSHDGVLLDPCAVTYGALQLLSASVKNDNEDTAQVESRDLTDFAKVRAGAQLPLPPGIVSRVSLLGQLLWQQHMWPWAVVALYGYVLLGGLWPQVVRSAETLSKRWLTRRGAGRQPALVSLLHCVVASEFSVTVFLAFFYGCTCLYAALTALYLAGTGQRVWFSLTYPWQWEAYPQLRHASTNVVAPLHFAIATVFFFLSSVGPFTVGVNAGMALVVVGDMTRCVKARVGRCRLAFGTTRRRRMVAVLFPLVVAALYAVFLVYGVSPTIRGVAWLVLFLLIPCFRYTQARCDGRSAVASPAAAAVADAGLLKHDADVVEIVFPSDFGSARPPAELETWDTQHLPGMLYATVYLIQLHPFFTIRNAIVSHTYDSAATMDGRNYIAEAGLLVLLCCPAVTPSLLPLCRCQLLGNSFHYVGVLCSIFALLAVAWILVRPVESFQVLSALLWCFPSFLFGTLSA